MAAAPPEAPGIHQLPDFVLSHMLGMLTKQDRHRSALVSQRWDRCAHAPELCRHVVLPQEAPGVRNPKQLTAALASLGAWLLRHGRHVRRVEVNSAGITLEADGQANMACGLAACAGGQLEALRVRLAPLRVSIWAPALRHSLRRLHLGSTCDELLISCSLHGLSQLTALQLLGKPVSFASDARLPSSVERLCFTDSASQELPNQLSTLSHLTALMLGAGRNWHADGASVLVHLPTLKLLELIMNHRIPACLGQLTGLETLVVTNVYHVNPDIALHQSVELNAALQQLTQLTCLHLDHFLAPGGLPALGGLSRLQRACFKRCDGLNRLPSGPWCRSLREVGAGWECLDYSPEFLAAATQLQQVVVLGGASMHVHTALLNWAAQHTALQQLHFYVGGQVPCEVLGAWGRLVRERPQLQLSQRGEPSTTPFEDSFKTNLRDMA